MKIEHLIQSGDFKGEKHVPVIEAPEKVKAGEKFTVQVSVGKEIAHPNTTEHHIRWIKLYYKPAEGKFPYEVFNVEFNVHGEAAAGPNQGPAYAEPVASALVRFDKPGTLVAASYCNIHGLWESFKEIDVEA
ncbi:MAG: class II SORL domain-containing protein [Synergistaceae bacterium]|nr:class II SORL domain-containing protein [Synergistaceae bacterium]